MIGKIPKIKIDYVPKNSPNRPGSKSNMQWITVHNTANLNSTAQNERDYVAVRGDNASFHYAVDDKEAIAIIPEGEVAWHTGNVEGNMKSIGVEICESGDAEETYKNALGLIAKILKDRNWQIDRVRTHESWSGKSCPRKLLPVWDEFLQDIKSTLRHITNEERIEAIPPWKLEGIHYLYNKDLLHDLEEWIEKIDEPMPVWAVTLLLGKIHRDLVELRKNDE